MDRGGWQATVHEMAKSRHNGTHTYLYGAAAAAAAKSLQLCPTRCDPIDSSPPGSPVPGILQARTLKWVAIGEASIKIPVGPGSGSSEVSIDMLG